jgi:hypothetical protein
MNINKKTGKKSFRESNGSDLDKKLAVLRDVMKKENEMLRKMISSLDALEKKLLESKKTSSKNIKD